MDSYGFALIFGILGGGKSELMRLYVREASINGVITIHLD